MAGTQMSLGQHLPSHCDELVNLVDGLSIKGAAVRRQQAIEHALLIGKPGIKMDPKTDTAGLPVPDGRKGEDKEITNDVSSINNQDVNAEIASDFLHHARICRTHQDFQAGWRSKQPSKLEAYIKGKELGIVRWPADADSSGPGIEAWVPDGEWPLPGSANPNPSPNIDSSKNTPNSVKSVGEPYRMVLREQSTNFPPLPSPTGHRDQPKWRAPQVLLPKKTPEDGSRGQAKGSASKGITSQLPVPNQTLENESSGRAEGSASYSRVPGNHHYNERLATNSSDFLSKATATLNNLRQPISSQARSPLSTERTGEAASSQIPQTTASPAGHKPTITMQQEPAHASVPDKDESQDVAGSVQENAESYLSVEPVRGQGDENRLSSIPESMFFEYAYNGEDASFASEVIFEGRRPKNPYKGPRVTRNLVPGWEGVEGPVYEPGQLVGWDGNWQEAPVEWDRRDLYDYTAKEHQNNVKNFIDDRYEQYMAGRCPPIEVTTDPLFKSGRALAAGFPYFAKPINEEEHHHLPPEDPYSQGKLTKTAAMSIENYLRVHEKRLKEQENRDHAAAERKKAAKAQRAEQQAREQALAEAAAAPNPYEPKLNIFIRPAEPKDLPQICEIHNYYVRTSAVTGERVELTEREWRTRFDTCQEDKFPFLVAILARHSKMNRRQGRTEKVVGFTYIEDFAGELTMWGHTCELQIFVDYKYLHQGVGKNLMDCILRGVNPNYQARNAVAFHFTPGQNDRYEGGGERVISNIIFPLPYTAEEDEHAQWVGQWLDHEFGFKLQGLLVGIGRVQKWGRRVNLAYYVAETGASI
ncbi:MAG: hypothetical protein L6R42_003309 [Xanthoria sp. 1 TBL-2021]|nr:MAG: hypothetical protein L6R42_003309 [Xanthoria sp. 1 TBL-2021]